MIKNVTIVVVGTRCTLDRRPFFIFLLLVGVGWGGVGWVGQHDTVEVPFHAYLMLRQGWGGVGWGGAT